MAKQNIKTPAKFKRGKTPKGGININQIVVRQDNRESKDLATWKQAINNFGSLQNPNRVKLYDLIADISLDGQIEATWGKRRDALLNKRLLFIRKGKENEEIIKLLHSPDMRAIIGYIQESVAWGYSLIQINNIYFDENLEHYKIDYELIPRKHVHPERGFECVSKEQYQATPDFLYMQPPLSQYMLWCGDAKDMGLLFKAAQYVIYKRGGLGDWAQFCEIFGMPFIELTYNDYDKATLAEIEERIRNRGSNASLIHPESSKLNIHETTGNGTDIHDRFIAFLDTSISKTILGNTLTTEAGKVGSQSLGNIHKEIEEQKEQSDMALVLSVLNGQFKAILKRFGFDVSGGEIWFESKDKDWQQLRQKFDVINSLADRVPISDDYFYEEFDVPKPDNYQQLKQEAESRNAKQQEQQQQVKAVAQSSFFGFPLLERRGE